MVPDGVLGQDELEKLLADVQRTIRENERFINRLKEEAVDSVSDGGEEEDFSIGEEGGSYEEL